MAPKVYARPFVLRVGQAVSIDELDDRLDDLGYTRRARATAPGEYEVGGATFRLIPRGGTAAAQTVEATIATDTGGKSARIATLRLPRGTVTDVELEAPLLTGVAPGTRGRQRQVPLSLLPAAAPARPPTREGGCRQWAPDAEALRVMHPQTSERAPGPRIGDAFGDHRLSLRLGQADQPAHLLAAAAIGLDQGDLGLPLLAVALLAADESRLDSQ